MKKKLKQTQVCPCAHSRRYPVTTQNHPEPLSEGFKRTHKAAFTLAEVLITLGIIGIVAAMTLPTLIQRQNEKQTVVKLKKNYSLMQQAYLMAINEHGTPDLWGLTTNDMSEGNGVVDGNNFLVYLKPYLKIVKYCGDKSEGCFSRNTYAMNGAGFNNHERERRYSKAVLSDGSSVLTLVLSPQCTQQRGQVENVCGIYRVDINGVKPPNAMGKDVFSFIIAKNGIVPQGVQIHTGAEAFSTDCRDSKTHYGRACAGWVIYNENMDYLHCSDLSWNGKKKCSD